MNRIKLDLNRSCGINKKSCCPRDLFPPPSIPHLASASSFSPQTTNFIHDTEITNQRQQKETSIFSSILFPMASSLSEESFEMAVAMTMRPITRNGMGLTSEEA